MDTPPSEPARLIRHQNASPTLIAARQSSPSTPPKIVLAPAADSATLPFRPNNSAPAPHLHPTPLPNRHAMHPRYREPRSAFQCSSTSPQSSAQYSQTSQLRPRRLSRGLAAPPQSSAPRD